MPKERVTCTRCSMRRQKCDKDQPCSRCVDAGVAFQCSRKWVGGYNPIIHRQYPRPGNGQQRRRSSLPSRRDPATVETPSKTSISSDLTNNNSREPVVMIMPDPKINLTADVFQGSSVSPGLDPSYVQQPKSPKQEKLHTLQQLLPPHTQLLQLIDYHEACLLWMHNCLHGPTFRQEVVLELHRGNDSIALDDIDMRWAALLFAILSASMACAPNFQLQRWNFVREHQYDISKNWFTAAMECLVMGEFTSQPHAWSVQTIQILRMSSHVFGLSDKQFVMHGTALQIAQNLQLQNLSVSPGGSEKIAPNHVEVARETGRRIWWNIVLADWFSIPSNDSCIVHPAHGTTARPRAYPSTTSSNPDLRDKDPLARLTNHCIDQATILVEFSIATMACADTASQYAVVLQYDKRLRQLINSPFRAWDATARWLPWAEHQIRAMIAHNIMMVHRHFLGRSFRDSSYANTRWASVEAAKTIVREIDAAFEDPERPATWWDHAYLISAGVTLCLENMHRSLHDPEFQEHQNLIHRARLLLRIREESVFASRGSRLLTAMLDEGTRDSIAGKDFGDMRDLIKSTEGLRMAWLGDGYEGHLERLPGNDFIPLSTSEGSWPSMVESPMVMGMGATHAFPPVATIALTSTSGAHPSMSALATLSPPAPTLPVHSYSSACPGNEIITDTTGHLLLPAGSLDHFNEGSLFESPVNPGCF